MTRRDSTHWGYIRKQARRNRRHPRLLFFFFPFAVSRNERSQSSSFELCQRFFPFFFYRRTHPNFLPFSHVWLKGRKKITSLSYRARQRKRVKPVQRPSSSLRRRRRRPGGIHQVLQSVHARKNSTFDISVHGLYTLQQLLFLSLSLCLGL